MIIVMVELIDRSVRCFFLVPVLATFLAIVNIWRQELQKCRSAEVQKYSIAEGIKYAYPTRGYAVLLYISLAISKRCASPNSLGWVTFPMDVP